MNLPSLKLGILFCVSSYNKLNGPKDPNERWFSLVLAAYELSVFYQTIIRVRRSSTAANRCKMSIVKLTISYLNIE